MERNYIGRLQRSPLALLVLACAVWCAYQSDTAQRTFAQTSDTSNGSKSAESPNKPSPRNKIDQKDKSAWGRYVSFQHDTLTLKGNSGELVWHNLSKETKVFRWDDAAHQYLPIGDVETLSKVERGVWVFVAEGRAKIQVGAGEESHVDGTFISFKNDRLLMQGKDLGNYAQNKKSQIQFEKFAENVPVFANTANGACKLIGAAETILPTLKERTPITVFAEGDVSQDRIDLLNITRIEIGTAK
jgi:hypothetical protein